ncbi:MAG: Hsp70 family protein, partial [Monoglobaceae bacterium]
MGIRVGIDLGTTFSAVARIDPETGKPTVIKNSYGSAITPSVLCFQKNGNILFGEDAKNMQSVGDTNAIAFFKRSMGKDMFSVDILGKTYNATDLSAILLQKLKEEAEQQTGEKIDSAVITVPAYFTHKERAATIEAGERAGLNVIAIINEPTAAAFAYGLNDKKEEQTVLIYDLGGGTFDVTLAHIDQNEISILGSDGDHELGGKDWDDCIARYLAEEALEKFGVDLSEDPEAVASLLVTAENVKKQLTSKNTVSVPI